MYHYVVIKTAIFFFVLLSSFLIFSDAEANLSPKQRWNYKKKEDNISHHTLRIRVKGNDRVSAVENQNGDIEEKRRGSNIRKPGSPRERW